MRLWRTSEERARIVGSLESGGSHSPQRIVQKATRSNLPQRHDTAELQRCNPELCKKRRGVIYHRHDTPELQRYNPELCKKRRGVIYHSDTTAGLQCYNPDALCWVLPDVDSIGQPYSTVERIYRVYRIQTLRPRPIFWLLFWTQSRRPDSRPVRKPSNLTLTLTNFTLI